MLKIEDIAAKLSVEVEPIGFYKGKIAPVDKPKGKLVLVTAINPTQFGEGKTTTSIGLADSLSRLGKKVCLALREPSLGPCFGIKGGAVGGGKSKVVPADEINLHFTGDFHAITSANNLVCAVLDNHIFHGNARRINPARICINRCVDMNDRALRNVVIGLGYQVREAHFDITVATELMAIFCLAKDFADLRDRLERMIVAYTYDNKTVTCGDLNCVGAMLALLVKAVKPNLVQTLEGTPALIHGGPFANIAHGCNSVLATKTALSLADIVVTEAGFGADLGAEKFLDIVCRQNNLVPSVAVLVASCRALKVQTLANLEKHILNLQSFGLPVVVALNHFADDATEDIFAVKELCQKLSVEFALSDVYSRGSLGGLDLAHAVLNSMQDVELRFPYNLTDSLADKIKAVAVKIYGAGKVEFSAKLDSLPDLPLPVCLAKTPLSLTDNPALKGCPKNFTVTCRSVKLSAGAGFYVAYLGNILTMPGLPKVPAAESVDVVDDMIVGLK